jgi:Ca2+-binding EF-hand superfamily protein
MTSDEDKESLLETFKAIDENGDGMISRKELLTGYRKVNDV